MTVKKILGILFCLLLTGCDDVGSDKPSVGFINFSLNGDVVCEETSDELINVSINKNTGAEVIEVTSHNGNLDFTVSTEDERDVYVVLTNPNDDSTLVSPSISTSMSSSKVIQPDSILNVSKNVISSEEDEVYEKKENEKVNKFNENPVIEGVTSKISKSIMQSSISRSSSSFLGETKDFYDSDNNVVSATNRKVVTANGVSLNVWVADDFWNHSEYPVTQTMVSELAYKFLKPGDNNDIFEWVTNICGSHWGSHSNLFLMDETDEIDILLFDIDNDGLESGAKTYGYFYGRDNFLQYFYSTSNERVMLNIDAPLFVKTEDSSWSIEGKYQQVMISTVAHEFQHLINFYQKYALNGSSSKTWLNELCSMAIQDLVSSKSNNLGPRGINGDDKTSGSKNNGNGRLPYYNFLNTNTLTEWSGTLGDYSINYAFGAYLIRNFGGADFIKAVVQNSETDTEAVTNALAELGYSQYDFEDVFHKFAVSNLLSEFTKAPEGMKLSNDTWFTSEENGEVYKLGSIDLNNYTYEDLAGPKIYSGDLEATLSNTSNLLYHVGSVDGNGSFTLDDIDSNMRVSIVVK